MRHQRQIEQNRIAPEFARVKDPSARHLDEEQPRIGHKFHQGKPQDPRRHLVLGVDHKKNAHGRLGHRHQQCQHYKPSVAVGHTLLRRPETEGSRRPDHDQHGKDLDRRQGKQPVPEAPEEHIDSRPCQAERQGQSLQARRIDCPLLFIFDQALGVHTVKEIQRDKDRDDPEPGIKCTVLPVFLRCQKTRKDRRRDGGYTLLQKRTYQEPEGSPYLYGHLLVFLQKTTHYVTSLYLWRLISPEIFL